MRLLHYLVRLVCLWMVIDEEPLSPPKVAGPLVRIGWCCVQRYPSHLVVSWPRSPGLWMMCSVAAASPICLNGRCCISHLPENVCSVLLGGGGGGMPDATNSCHIAVRNGNPSPFSRTCEGNITAALIIACHETSRKECPAVPPHVLSRPGAVEVVRCTTPPALPGSGKSEFNEKIGERWNPLTPPPPPQGFARPGHPTYLRIDRHIRVPTSVCPGLLCPRMHQHHLRAHVGAARLASGRASHQSNSPQGVNGCSRRVQSSGIRDAKLS